MTTIINASSSAGLVQTADTSAILQLQTASTAALTIDASQRVGVTATSPRRNLEVAGTIAAPTALATAITTSANGTIVIADTGGTVGSVIGTSLNGSSYDTYIQARNMGAASTPYNLILNPLGGNVGIGTTTPSSFPFGKLVIGTTSGNGSATIASATTGEGTIAFADGTTGTDGYRGFIQYNHTNDALIFGTSGAEDMRIDSSGNLLVGATSVAQSGKFEVNGGSGDASAFINDSSNSARPIKCWNKASSGQRMIAFLTGTGATFAGGIECASTTTTYATSSDYRLKENIAPMTGALAKVAQLKPVTYKWKLDGSVGEGFIAHELQAVVPNCVTGTKDAVDENGKPEYQGIDTSFLVATLTAAIQEQQALITQLQADVAALKGAK
jgi:hypothetical protein